MSQPQAQQSGLNEIQLTLLRLFSRPMNEQETHQLRDLLTSFYSEQLLTNVDEVVQERGITEVDYERLRHTSRNS
jgi:hypothetical protein